MKTKINNIKRNVKSLVDNKSHRLTLLYVLSLIIVVLLSLLVLGIDRNSFDLDRLNSIDYIKEETFIVAPKSNIFVEVVDTKSELERGLSGKLALKDKQGMLFIFPKESVLPFWMKEMNFAIDIIWLDENMKVVHIVEGAMPENYPEIYKNIIPAKYVLEINSGASKDYGIEIGSVLAVDMLK